MRPVPPSRDNPRPTSLARLPLVAAAVLLLAACNLGANYGPTATPEGTSLLPDEPHLEQQSVDELFAAAGTYLQTGEDQLLISFRCTIVEGTFCWFGERTQDGAVAGELARRVVDQLGPGAIENANRNEVAVRCFKPLGDGAATCEIDWGWGAGWEPLPLN